MKILWPKKGSKHIYLDANNLYSYAISKFLPTSKFEWINPKEFDSSKYSSNNLKGCSLEVDAEYPKELRELHNDYLLARDRNKKMTCCLMINYRLLIFIIFPWILLKS